MTKKSNITFIEVEKEENFFIYILIKENTEVGLAPRKNGMQSRVIK